jgi:serine/threonine-protein kinase
MADSKTAERDPEPPSASSEELRAIARLLSGGGAAPAAEAAQAAEPEAPANGRSNGAAGARRVAGRFLVEARLGDGPHGRVFRARDDARGGRAVALKILRVAEPDEDFQARLRREVSAQTSLGHEGWNRWQDGGRTELGLPWLAAELVRGESLRGLLERAVCLRPAHALEIARQVLAALEPAHAAGLSHGGIKSQNVALCERVPWSAENPHAVAVRLLDPGLGRIVAPDEPGATSQDDLWATGLLLVEMLTGTRPVPDGPHWRASQAAVGLAGAARETRALVDRALAGDPAQRFQDAASFRRAIEGLADWSGRRPPPLAWMAATGGLTAASLFLLALWLGERGSSVRAAGSAGALEREALQAAQAARTDSEREARELGATIAGLAADLERVRQDEAAWRQRAQASQESGADLEQARAGLVARATELEAALASAREELARSLEAAAAARLLLERAHRAATALEGVLVALEADAPDAARATWQALLDERGAELGPLAGEPAVGALVELALREREARQEEDPAAAARAVLVAEETCAAALARARAFAAEAAGWQALATASGLAEDRSARLLRAGLGLEERLRKLAASLRPSCEEAWRGLLAGTPDVAPERVIPLAHFLGGGRDAAFLERVIERATGLGGWDATFDRTRLARLGSLEAWATLAADDPSLCTHAQLASLLVVRYAAHFWDPALADLVLPALELPPDLALDALGAVERARDWRSKLILARALLASDSAWPGAEDSLWLYRVLAADGSTSWQVERLTREREPAPGETARWRVSQTFHDPAGKERGARELSLVQRGKRFFEEDERSVLVLDLAASAGGRARVGPWSPRVSPEVPEHLPIDRAAVLAFRKRLAERPVLALRIEEDGRASAFSPELGPLLRLDSGRLERELVYGGAR